MSPIRFQDAAEYRTMQSLLARIRSAASEEIDSTFLIYFRIAFGAILVCGIMKYFHQDQIWTCFLEPRLHFTYVGFGMVRPLPGYGMYVLFMIIATAAACIMLGYRYQIATTVFFFAFTYAFLIDQSWYLNHYYMVCLVAFLLQFLPSETACSIDSFRDPTIASATVPRWTLWILRIQIGIPYVYGGIAKLNPDWLRGEPMRTWLAGETDVPLIGQFFREEWCVYMFSYGGLLVDLIGIPLLMWKRTRWIAFAAICSFHLLNARLFNIGIFPWLMLAVTTVLFLPQELIAKLRFWKLPATSPDAPQDKSRFELPTVGRAMLVGFVLVQLIIPFRHWLYPGAVAVTREAHYFSWRMKLNSRSMDVKLNVYHANGTVEPVRMHEWVAFEQSSRFRDLDQVLQLARAVGRHHEAIDKQPVTVRGTVTVAVNTNKPIVLVRDNVDLSRIRSSILPATWIETHPSRSTTQLDHNQPNPLQPPDSNSIAVSTTGVRP